jgi:hypothetical protein
LGVEEIGYRTSGNVCAIARLAQLVAAVEIH